MLTTEPTSADIKSPCITGSRTHLSSTMSALCPWSNIYLAAVKSIHLPLITSLHGFQRTKNGGYLRISSRTCNEYPGSLLKLPRLGVYTQHFIQTAWFLVYQSHHHTAIPNNSYISPHHTGISTENTNSHQTCTQSVTALKQFCFSRVHKRISTTLLSRHIFVPDIPQHTHTKYTVSFSHLRYL